MDPIYEYLLHYALTLLIISNRTGILSREPTTVFALVHSRPSLTQLNTALGIFRRIYMDDQHSRVTYCQIDNNLGLTSETVPREKVK